MSDTCAIPSADAPADKDTAQDSAPFDPGPGKHVLYFGDPMCSWCWGFAPELARIADAIKGRAQLHIVMGGLRPGTAEAWDQEMRDYIRHHWEDVATKTGQPFDYARFDDENFVYDTEPSCRALVTVRSLKPAATLAMYEALQRGFYAEGLNLGDAATLEGLAQQCGVDRAAFAEMFTATETRAQTVADFKRSRAFGVTGFPSLVCAEDGQYAVLSLGYRTFASMQMILDEWLNA